MNVSKVRKFVLLIFIISLFILSFLYYHDVRPTGMTTFLPSPSQNGEDFNNILPIKPLTFYIYAEKNNFGIIEIRFKSLKRIEDYGLLFRIRKRGDTAWFYEHVYYFNPFIQNGLYPFGFPPINDSKGKQYEVELSTIGNKDVPMLISNQYPSIVLKYQTPLSSIKLLGAQSILSFASEKVLNTLTNRNFLINILFFCFPLGFVYPLIFRKKIDEIVIFGSLLNTIFFDSLKIIHIESDMIYAFVFIWFLYLIIINTLYFSDILKIGLFTFICSIILVLWNQIFLSERFAIWTYILGIIAVISYVITYRKKGQDRSLSNIMTTSLIYIIIFISIITICNSLYQIAQYSRKLIQLKKPNNTNVSYLGPEKNYIQGFCVIEGSGFGDLYDGSLRILSDYGEIEEYSWSDNKIIFRIPLNWNIGKANVWLENKGGIKTNQYEIQILDKSSDWNIDDSNYYQELKIAPQVVKEINGYVSGWYQ